MSASTPQERLRIALDLADTGIELKRMQIRREHPEWDEKQVATAMQAWLLDRPGAPFGDYPGRPSLRWLAALRGPDGSHPDDDRHPAHGLDPSDGHSP